jgi:two-component system, OmpR family, sensor kinase
MAVLTSLSGAASSLGNVTGAFARALRSARTLQDERFGRSGITGLPPFLTGVRTRVLAWFLFLLTFSLVVSVFATRQVLLAYLDNEIEASLNQEVAELEALAVGNDPATGQPFGRNVPAIFDTFLRRNIPAEGEALYTLVGGRPYRTSDSAAYALLDDTSLVQRWSALRTAERGTLRTPAGEARYLAAPVSDDGEVLGTFVVANFPAHERQEVDQAVRVEAIV